MNCRKHRNTCLLALGIAIISAASVTSIVGSYRAEVLSHRRVLLERGQTVLDALHAGILAHGRMGRFRTDRLGIIFEELARSADILALALRDPDGTVIASGGRADALPKSPPEKPCWQTNTLTLSKRVSLAEACGSGGDHRGPAAGAAWQPFRDGVYALSAVLDVTEVHAAIRRHRLHMVISLVLTFGALGSGLFSVLLLLKRTSLAAELERLRERASRQEQLTRLGAGLAHETKNPLGIIRGLAQAIGSCAAAQDPGAEYAAKIVDEVDRVIGGINSFLALARPKEAVLAELDLDAFFGAFLPLVQMDASAAGVEISYRPCGCRVRADGELLRRALLNLLLNALRASQPGQAVRIEATRAGRTLALSVSDSGCGIAAEDLPRVTEPYFSRFSGGSGLGLAIVEQIAAAHGWRLSLSSQPGQGTQATLAGIELSEVT